MKFTKTFIHILQGHLEVEARTAKEAQRKFDDLSGEYEDVIEKEDTAWGEWVKNG